MRQSCFRKQISEMTNIDDASVGGWYLAKISVRRRHILLGGEGLLLSPGHQAVGKVPIQQKQRRLLPTHLPLSHFVGIRVFFSEATKGLYLMQFCQTRK
jgi:hypothetical protein